MYPRISDLFEDFLGFELPFPIYSFGLMLAVAILTAAWLAGRELDRMYRTGRVGGVRVPVDDEKGRKRGRTREASPSVLIGTIAIIAAVGGIVGSKIFHILENLDQFALDPMGMIFSTGGLTFYGGLIVAGVSIAWYVNKKDLSIGAFADAVAPGLMIGYGIGRIGCHLAGDGDWGIAADIAAKPDWLPMWLWAESYPNAIIGPPPQPVYPTSIYEFLMAAAIFGILWAVRKHPFANGWLFSLYLVFNGVERYLIEQIRVNNMLDFLLFRATQAEVIAVMTMLAGVAGLVYTSRHRREDAAPPPADTSPEAEPAAAGSS
jgi:phosphatidylglycerol:prolipoprotein diacylglycerol transferase